MTIAEQIKQDQDAAMLVIRRVAESLPGFTIVESGGRMNGSGACATNAHPIPDRSPELAGEPADA